MASLCTRAPRAVVTLGMANVTTFPTSNSGFARSRIFIAKIKETAPPIECPVKLTFMGPIPSSSCSLRSCCCRSSYTASAICLNPKWKGMPRRWGSAVCQHCRMVPRFCAVFVPRTMTVTSAVCVPGFVVGRMMYRWPISGISRTTSGPRTQSRRSCTKLSRNSCVFPHKFASSAKRTSSWKSGAAGASTLRGCGLDSSSR